MGALTQTLVQITEKRKVYAYNRVQSLLGQEQDIWGAAELCSLFLCLCASYASENLSQVALSPKALDFISVSSVSIACFFQSLILGGLLPPG